MPPVRWRLSPQQDQDCACRPSIPSALPPLQWASPAQASAIWRTPASPWLPDQLHDLGDPVPGRWPLPGQPRGLIRSGPDIGLAAIGNGKVLALREEAQALHPEHTGDAEAVVNLGDV